VFGLKTKNIFQTRTLGHFQTNTPRCFKLSKASEITLTKNGPLTVQLEKNCETLRWI
jgi:hypothetical protein